MHVWFVVWAGECLTCTFEAEAHTTFFISQTSLLDVVKLDPGLPCNVLLYLGMGTDGFAWTFLRDQDGAEG